MKPHVRTPALLLLPLFAVSVLTACDRPKVLRVAQSTIPEVLRPPGELDVDANRVSRHVFEALLRVRADGSIAPGLADSWEYDTTRTELQLHLRDSILMHDGTVLTAPVVCASIRSRLDGSSLADPAEATGYRRLLGDPISVEAQGVQDLVIRIPRPHAPLLATLGSNWSFPIYKPNPSDGSDTLPYIGTGPYTLWRINAGGDHLYLRRFPDYWGRPPAADVIRFTPYANSEEAVRAIQAGEEDLTGTLSVTETMEVNAAQDVVLVTGSATDFLVMGINCQHAPLDDPRIREALAMSIDVPKLVRDIYRGAATPATSFIGQGLHPQMLFPRAPGFSPESARKVLVELLGTDPPPFRLLFPPATSPRKREQVMSLLRASLANVGLTLMPDYADDWEQYGRALATGDWDLSIDGLATSNGDLYEFLYTMYVATGDGMGHGLFGVESQRVVPLFERARTSLSDDVQHQALEELISEVTGLVPCVPLADISKFLARSTRVVPFELGAYASWDFAYVVRSDW